MRKVGLALGGGGVRGLAHIAVLELLDEMKIRPCALAGCSMGAIIGGLYATGLSGKAIRRLVEKLHVKKGEALEEIWAKRQSLLKWFSVLFPEFGKGGMMSADRTLRKLLEPLEDVQFEELEIPLTVVATDFWKAQEVTFRKGDILTAIGASMAIPAVFAPHLEGERVLVDGGLVNELPYDLLPGECEIRVAVDVAGERVPPGKHQTPSHFDAIFGAFDILQNRIKEQKLRYDPPDLVIRPQFQNLSVLDFSKIEEVCADDILDGERVRAELKELLDC